MEIFQRFTSIRDASVIKNATISCLNLDLFYDANFKFVTDIYI